MSEEGAGHQVFGHSSAVQCPQWTILALAVVVDGLGYQFLASAGLPGDEHSQSGVYGSLHQCVHHSDALRVADDVLEAILPSHLLPQLPHLSLQ